MLGNGRLEAQCFDGEKRLAHIRGKMRKKVWINQGDIILLSLRDFQDDKADVIQKYTPDEARNLKSYGELPDNLKINETDTFGPGEGDDGVDFDDDASDDEEIDVDGESLAAGFLPSLLTWLEMGERGGHGKRGSGVSETRFGEGGSTFVAQDEGPQEFGGFPPLSLSFSLGSRFLSTSVRYTRMASVLTLPLSHAPSTPPSCRLRAAFDANPQTSKLYSRPSHRVTLCCVTARPFSVPRGPHRALQRPIPAPFSSGFCDMNGNALESTYQQRIRFPASQRTIHPRCHPYHATFRTADARDRDPLAQQSTVASQSQRSTLSCPLAVHVYPYLTLI